MWTADIGTWDKGFRVTLPDVNNLESALKVAGDLVLKHEEELRSLYKPHKSETPYVVQIFKDKQKVWSAINGTL